MKVIIIFVLIISTALITTCVSNSSDSEELTIVSQDILSQNTNIPLYEGAFSESVNLDSMRSDLDSMWTLMSLNKQYESGELVWTDTTEWFKFPGEMMTDYGWRRFYILEDAIMYSYEVKSDSARAYGIEKTSGDYTRHELIFHERIDPSLRTLKEVFESGSIQVLN